MHLEREALAMERWRAFFTKSNSDIWTVIEQAINVAAVDHPEVFKEKRGDIAETLFSRSLVQTVLAQDEFALLGVASDDEQPVSIMEEGELKDDYEEKGVTTCLDDGSPRLHICYDEAQVLHDDEAVMIEEMNTIKQAIKHDDQPENILLKNLHRLEDMQITVTALKATEIGKQVNILRKHPSKSVRAVVKQLVKHWKFLVDEWVKVSGDASDEAVISPVGAAGSHFRDETEIVTRLQTPVSPPLNATLSTEENPSGDLFKVLSFIDDDICGQTKRSAENLSNSNEHSAKGSVQHNSCTSQSGSGLTYSSDWDARVSTSQTWGLQTPGEMGSATRDNHISEGIDKGLELISGRLPTKSDTGRRGLNHPVDSRLLPKTLTKDPNAARTNNDVSKRRVVSCPEAAGKPINDSSYPRKSSVLHSSEGSRIIKSSTMNKAADKSHVEQKLEIAKRKLHQGYQQAENAKKQRTVQVLDFPDLPKGSEMRGKVNSAVQSKGSHWGGQMKRHG